MKRPNGADLSTDDLKRRAVDAVIWGMPIVAVDAMRQAFFRDAGAHYGDILYWSKPPDWKSATPNASARYIYFNFNLKDGPLVLDVPAAEGAGLFGSIVDAWEVPVADLGVAGIDGGKGGKYVLDSSRFHGADSSGVPSRPVRNVQRVFAPARHVGIERRRGRGQRP